MDAGDCTVHWPQQVKNPRASNNIHHTQPITPTIPTTPTTFCKAAPIVYKTLRSPLAGPPEKAPNQLMLPTTYSGPTILYTTPSVSSYCHPHNLVFPSSSVFAIQTMLPRTRPGTSCFRYRFAGNQTGDCPGNP